MGFIGVPRLLLAMPFWNIATSLVLDRHPATACRARPTQAVGLGCFRTPGKEVHTFFPKCVLLGLYENTIIGAQKPKSAVKYAPEQPSSPARAVGRRDHQALEADQSLEVERNPELGRYLGVESSTSWRSRELITRPDL